MSRKDKRLLILAIVLSALIASLFSKVLFRSVSHTIKVPEVEAVSADFPSVSGDTTYKRIFNAQALDPTQAVQLGSQNGQPFGR